MNKLILHCAVSVLSLLVVFIITEVFFTFFNPYNLKPRWNYSEEQVRDTFFKGVKMTGTLNSIGARDREYELSHDNFRVLALGDSFTYGLRLLNINSWPKKTERFLRDDGYTDIDVINCGLPGTDTDFQYRFFAENTLKYKPDLVVVCFLINDATVIPSNTGAVRLKQNFDALIEESENNDLFGMRTLNFIKLTFLKWRLTNETVQEYYRPYEENSESFLKCKKAFLNFQEMSKTHNFKLIVVIYPMLYQLNKDHPFYKIHGTMMDFFKRSDIEAYDLTPSFYGCVDTDLWITDFDSHPNKQANEIAAGRIADVIKPHIRKPGLFKQ